MSDFFKKASSKISKLSPEQIERLMENAGRQNSVFSSIIESLSTGLIIVDNEFRIIQINKAALRLLFNLRKSDELNGEFLCDLIEDKKICSYLAEIFSSKKTNTNEEFSVQVHDKIHFISLSVQPFVGFARDEERDSILGSIITIDDVTRKREQEIVMHRMESLASLTTLAASVAHEIKNPLGAISIHIQLLQKAIKKARNSGDRLPEPKFLENYIDVVNEEIENLNKIVLDFLFAVRPVHSTMELLEPDEIVEKTALFFKPEFSQKNIVIETNLSKEKTTLLIDGKLFREVLINLCQNALAAMKDGGNLTLGSSVSAEKYTLTVSDTGCGMDENTSSKIFEPYFTTKADGTGLGLTMVYKIIKEFKGDITVESEPGKGTVFTITIPVPQKETMLLCHDSKKEGS